jgi:di/tripeptidase
MPPRYNVEDDEEENAGLAGLQEPSAEEGDEDAAAAAEADAAATAREERKRKRKLERKMYESEDARRKIRTRQRTLHEEIQGATTAEELHGLRAANNDVFRNVRHTREAALDAENNLLLATKMVQNAERLVQVRGGSLLEKAGEGE